VQKEMIEHDRLENLDASTAVHIEQRNTIIERGEQHFVGCWIGLVSKSSISVYASGRLVYREPLRHPRCLLGHTRLKTHLT